MWDIEFGNNRGMKNFRSKKFKSRTKDNEHGV
jgi:hypothetical protein